MTGGSESWNVTSVTTDFRPEELRCWCGGAVISMHTHIEGRLQMRCAEDRHHNWRAKVDR
jgi:hypothetical protein